MTAMFLVEIEVTLSTGRRLTDDEISDLIEAVIDELDPLAVEPSVGTRRSGGDLEMTIGVVVDAADELRAVAKASTLVQRALDEAGLSSPRNVRPRVVREPA